ncbi:hypothetical protein FAM09_03420 [Niastella caeni]|uniref:Uncharacterized protein n=1 Tax=Niastella caeni TaxID=2569763 RepID=A0A4V4H1N1_9BACT|nr:hypothetical protein [Niastella caeni]THU41176.1 hypothetical protein FAM09_03420 [Niastella caeni]
MPQNIREFHRFLEIGQAIPAQRLILGSFSVAHLTNYETGINPLKKNHSGLDFFYGSNKNQFWRWYQKYLDVTIEPANKDSILTSLEKNQIAISDLISSCERKEYSALDSSLSKITWNLPGIIPLLNTGQINTVLCTSKWVMQNLEKIFLKTLTYKYNPNKSFQIQKDNFPFIKKDLFPQKPLITIYEGTKSSICLIALPTPGGGTYRRLDSYGYNSNLNNSSDEFIDLYLKASFKLFMTGQHS